MDDEEVRQLVQSGTRGTLSTLDPDTGVPYGSVVEYLPLDIDRIAFLLSDLATHTRHLGEDGRSSFLVTDEPGAERPLEKPRATLMGRTERYESETSLRDAYLELHPHAEQYIDFEDFRFYVLKADRLRYIGGFGDMGWLRFDGD